MNNFVFQNHTRIYFGKGVVKDYLTKLLEPYGTNVMIAYGGGSVKNTGVYEAVANFASRIQATCQMICLNRSCVRKSAILRPRSKIIRIMTQDPILSG